MEKSTTIVVPSIFEGLEREGEFREELNVALERNEIVVLDFRSQPAVSSPVIGMIMYRVATNANRVQFSHVSNYLHETLTTVMGELAENLISGNIVDLDD